MSHSPTPEQQSVYDFISSGQGHGVVEAYAGTGKTTTIVGALQCLPRGTKALFVAFNKSIARTLQERCPAGVDAMTLHSLGLKAITRAHGRRPIDGDATRTAIREAWPEGSYEARTAVAKVLAECKAQLAQPSEVIWSLDLDVEDDERTDVLGCSEYILGEQISDRVGAINFDDMIWLPAALDLNVGKYDFVFVDETQDLNPAQLYLVRHAIRSGGRILAIGDRRQSIYGFRGADAEAIPRMIAELDATVLPLSVTFRCPRGVVAEANSIVPKLVAAPSAPDGIVRSASRGELECNAAPGDFVLSRTNAPLVSLCYAWLANGVSAMIRGRDIGASLAAWYKRQCLPGATAADAVERIAKWSHAECARLEREEKDTQAVVDKADCLRALLSGCDTVADAIRKCETLFSDADPARSIMLSSTHRAKGLEAPRVWVLRDTYCKSRVDRYGERLPVPPEEYNLLYVAVTRSQHELIYVNYGAP